MQLYCFLFITLYIASKADVSFGFVIDEYGSIRRWQSLRMTSTTNSQFPFVHESIAQVLACSSHGDPQRELVNPKTLEITWNPLSNNDVASTDILQELARSSERALFPSSPLRLTVPMDKPMQGLIHLASKQDDSYVLASTLLAVNRLESAIRQATGHATGSAPLLKTMLHEIADTSGNHTLSCILCSLLLPTPGLNLRNLLWHGFVAYLPRTWLALVLVLTFHLQQQAASGRDQSSPNPPLQLVDFTSFPSFKAILDEAQTFDKEFDKGAIQRWLPCSHHGLLDLAVHWKQCMPACAAALCSILLEHGLRLAWCQANRRPHHILAQPGAYYVTLDGHGQRLQHDLLLHPYLTTSRSSGVETKNELVTQLDGATVALLTDLFASSCGGPNIRAALSHGLWDSLLEQELLGSLPSHNISEGNAQVQDVVTILGAALEASAGSVRTSVQHYKPLFSYAAVTQTSLRDVLHQIQQLSDLKVASGGGGTESTERSVVRKLQLPANLLQDTACEVQKLCGGKLYESNVWTSDYVFQEYECNIKLAPCGASRTLLADVNSALSLYLKVVHNAIREVECGDSLTTCQRRRLQRLLTVKDFVKAVYGFAAYVGLLALRNALCAVENPSRLPSSVLLKGVERSRMCVSTVSTFLTTNTDRAIKSSFDYTKGKAVKEILLYTQGTYI